MNEKQRTSGHSLLRRILGPAGPELTCEQCFEELDRFVELELSGADADAAVPGMRAHLEGCGACDEDHRSLRALMETENASAQRRPSG
jgi:hypothetical protein